ncbi:hypothetical protein [Streptomyces spiramyceticus]|uniref:hypothetical protein n=1 Tax=Streptomyces spiramyceticus TaxID=299717 RepID=UPI003B75BBA6
MTDTLDATVDDLVALIDRTLHKRFGGLQHRTVDIRHVSDIAGVLPAPFLRLLAG